MNYSVLVSLAQPRNTSCQQVPKFIPAMSGYWTRLFSMAFTSLAPRRAHTTGNGTVCQIPEG